MVHDRIQSNMVAKVALHNTPESEKKTEFSVANEYDGRNLQNDNGMLQRESNSAFGLTWQRQLWKKNIGRELANIMLFWSE